MPKNGKLDARDRAAALDRLAGTEFDVLVIGGGITGAGAALDAASRGLRVALVEARDLASGTSSRSSKLIHGGLRYLEQFDFKLVWEALRERDLLVSKLAPHLVKPVSFLYPLHRKVLERPYVGAGLVLYDAMEGTKRPVPHHKHLTVRGALRLAPGLKPAGLAGALLYYDAQTDDARYTVTVARTAAAHGALIANRVSAQKLLRGRGRGQGRGGPGPRRGDRPGAGGAGQAGGAVRRRVDRPGARAGRYPGRVQGADVQGRAHRGAVRGDPGPTPGSSPRTEKSVLFIIPWGQRWIVGTTDTDWTGDRAEPTADRRGHRLHPGARQPGAGPAADPGRRDRCLRRAAAAGRGGRFQADDQAVPRARGRHAGARADQHRGRQVHHLPADGPGRGGRGRGRLRPLGARRRSPTSCRCWARTAWPPRRPRRSGWPRTTACPPTRSSTCSSGTGR